MIFLGKLIVYVWHTDADDCALQRKKGLEQHVGKLQM